MSTPGGSRDPQGMQEIVEALYTDEAFYRALYNGLAPNGILISQVGESSYLDDPYYTFAEDRHYASFVNGLKLRGFGTIAEYEEVSNLASTRKRRSGCRPHTHHCLLFFCFRQIVAFGHPGATLWHSNNVR